MKRNEEEKLLYKLAISKLRLPSGLKRYVHKNSNALKKSQKSYVNSLELWHERLLLRTFAFNNEECITEVCRRLEGCSKVLLNDIENRPMSGRYVWFTDTIWDTDWYKRKGIYTGSSAYWKFDEYGELFVKEDWIQRLEIPYCCYFHELNHSHLSFFDYICIYRKYPKIELLLKAGWSNLVRYARWFNWKEKTFEKIFGISDKWKPYMHELDLSYIRFIKKHLMLGVSEVRAVRYCETRDLKNINKYMDNKMMKFLGNLVENNKLDLINIYDDYLKFAERLGYNMQFNKILYPNDIIKNHDAFMNKFEEIKCSNLKKGILKQGKKLAKYKYRNDKFCIFPAMKPEEFIDESKALNHCVRTYAEKVARGETGILFIRENGKPSQPFYTLELKGKKVIQVRGYKNDPCTPEVDDFVKQWENRYHLNCN